MVPAPVLAAARQAATASLDVPGIQVQRVTRTPDGYGTATETWATLATVSGAWAKPSASVMQAYAGLIGSLAAWVVRLPYGQACRNGDRLLMPSGDTLVVQADLSEHSNATCVRVLATEVR